MGLSHGTISHYCQLISEGHLASKLKVLELGRQQLNDLIFLHPESTDQFCQLLGKPSFFDSCKYNPQVKGEKLKDIINDECPFANELFKHLGVEYEAVDMVDGCTKMNLNCDSVPSSKMNHFNLVTNYGTTEHLINQENAFKIIHDFTAPNGLMIHELPYQGYFQHGFFGYTSTFFTSLASYNDYEIIQLDLNFCEPHSFAEMNDELNCVKKYGSVNNIDINAKIFFDGGIYVVLRKKNDAPFVTPLDIPVGKMTSQNKFYMPTQSSLYCALISKMKNVYRKIRDAL